MRLNAYSIFDSKALHYNQPFFALTDGVAVRMLSDLVNDLNTQIGRHPSDYVLYCVGWFSDSFGQLNPDSPLRHVCDAVSLVKLENPQQDLFRPQVVADLTEATAENIEKLKRSVKGGA